VLQALSSLEELTHFFRRGSRELEGDIAAAAAEAAARARRKRSASRGSGGGLAADLWAILERAAAISDPKPFSGDVARTYAALLSQLWDPKTKLAAVAPQALHDCVGRHVQRFAGLEQHDASEYFSEFVDLLHENLGVAAKSGSAEDVDKAPIQSIVTRLFEGEEVAQTRCPCGHVSERKEAFRMLTLALPHTVRAWRLRVVSPQAQPGFVEGSIPRSWPDFARFTLFLPQPSTVGALRAELSRKVLLLAKRASLLDSATSSELSGPSEDKTLDRVSSAPRRAAAAAEAAVAAIAEMGLAIAVVTGGLVREVLDDSTSTRQLSSDALVAYILPKAPGRRRRKSAAAEAGAGARGSTRSASEPTATDDPSAAARVLADVTDVKVEYAFVKVIHRVRVWEVECPPAFKRPAGADGRSNAAVAAANTHWAKAILESAVDQPIDALAFAASPAGKTAAAAASDGAPPFWHAVESTFDAVDFPDRAPDYYVRTEPHPNSLPLLMRVVASTKHEAVLNAAQSWASSCWYGGGASSPLADRHHDTILPDGVSLLSSVLPPPLNRDAVLGGIKCVDSLGMSCAFCGRFGGESCDGCPFVEEMESRVALLADAAAVAAGAGTAKDARPVNLRPSHYPDTIALEYFSEADRPRRSDLIRLQPVWKEYRTLNAERKRLLPSVLAELQQPASERRAPVMLPDPLSVVPRQIVPPLVRGANFCPYFFDFDDESVSAAASAKVVSAPPSPILAPLPALVPSSKLPLLSPVEPRVRERAPAAASPRERCETDHESELSLAKCLDLFTAESRMDMSNLYACAACKTRQRARRSTAILRPPEVLVVLLKRFVPLNDSGLMDKVESVVTFPVRGFDLSPWVQRRASEVQALYDLNAVVHHTGSMTQGHYVASVRHGAAWFAFNDEKAEEMRLGEAELQEQLQQAAYLLFYKRRAE
jgi:hypothetical protein